MLDGVAMVFVFWIVFAFVIAILIFRWVFGQQKIVRQLTKQTEYLNGLGYLCSEQKSLIKLLVIEKLADTKKIKVTAKKDGTVIYPTLGEWLEKYTTDAYTTEIIKS